jgi:hypothetical protein
LIALEDVSVKPFNLTKVDSTFAFELEVDDGLLKIKSHEVVIGTDGQCGSTVVLEGGEETVRGTRLFLPLPEIIEH